LTFAPSIATAATRPTTTTTVSTAKNPKLGTILVSGTTVYALRSSKTACTAKCLKVWRPVLLPRGVMAATAGTGVDASKLGTIATTNGALQITYSGQPLYWFAKDTAPGQVKGNVKNKWGKWYAVVLPTTVAPAAAPPATDAPATAPPATDAPATDAPATAPPAPKPTAPPAPKPPPATSPSTGGTAF
jgi:predicted lipoprotein with Yx(FWY)xxD motif